MTVIYQNIIEIQGGIAEASDNILAIINQLETVEEHVSSLVQELDGHKSNDKPFLELKRMAEACAGQLSEALSSAQNLQAKQTDLASHLNSTCTTEQIRAIITDIQRETGAFSTLISSLNQSFDKMKELSEELQTASQTVWSRLRAKVWNIVAVIVGVVALVVGVTLGPVVGALAAVGLSLTAIHTNIIDSITRVVGHFTSRDVNWDVALSHIYSSAETLTDVQSAGQGLKDHASATHSFLDKFEEMEQKNQEMEQKNRAMEQEIQRLKDQLRRNGI